jgi:polyhydroxybutyrate depolymerase
MSGFAFRLAFAAAVVAALLLFVLINTAQGRGRFRNVQPGRDYAPAMVHGRLKRTYIVHVPKTYDRQRSRPMVLVLHGGGGDGRKVAQLTRFSRMADEAGFIVVYPNAVNGHWNDGRDVRRFRSQREDVDDVGFLAALIDRLVQDLNADSARVYVSGMSNGAMMCHRLACERAEKIAAIASVAGTLPDNLLGSCRPARPVSVLLINGTADPVVPYSGGGVGLAAKRGRVASALETAEFWAQADSCQPKPETLPVIDTDTTDGTRVRSVHWTGGRDGSEVILHTVEGGGHTWPGGAARARLFGRTARDINATEVIWQFFERHTRE